MGRDRDNNIERNRRTKDKDRIRTDSCRKERDEEK